MKTTKGGKFMNPTDAYRKELRKRELKRNKKERKKVREVGILKKDPEAIKEQIRKLEMMKADGALDKTRRHKKRQLEDTLNLVLKKRKEYEEKMREKGEEPVMFSHLPAPRRRATPAEEEERAKHMKPEDSVYYHPTLNPSGAPPPGKPPMYKSSIGPRIPLTGESSGSKVEGNESSAEAVAPQPTLPLTTEEVVAPGEAALPLPVPLPPPPPAPPRPVSTTVTTQPPPPSTVAVSEQTRITRDLPPPPPPPPRIPLSAASGVTAEKPIKPPGTDDESLLKSAETGSRSDAGPSEEPVSSAKLPPPPPRRQVPVKVAEEGEDLKIEKMTPSADGAEQKIPPPLPMRPPPAMMRPPPGPPPIPPQPSSSDFLPAGVPRLPPPPPPPGMRPVLPMPPPPARPPMAAMAPPPRPPTGLPPAPLPKPPHVAPAPPGPPLMRPPPGPPPMMNLYRPPQSAFATPPPPPPPRRLDGVEEPSKSAGPSKPSYIKTAAATVVKRPLAQHTPELTSMVPASVRVRRENAQKARPKTSANVTSVSAVTPMKPASAPSVVKPQSIDDSYSAFLEDMKALGAFDDTSEAVK